MVRRLNDSKGETTPSWHGSRNILQKIHIDFSVVVTYTPRFSHSTIIGCTGETPIQKEVEGDGRELEGEKKRGKKKRCG